MTSSGDELRKTMDRELPRLKALSDVGWAELLELWRAYNIQLAHVMDHIPSDRLSLPRMPHNLHRVAWRLVPEDQPATLAYFIADYVDHMKHHLSQIP